MSTIVTRAGKGSALTHNEVDANFNNLNTDKLQSGNTAAALTITTATFGAGTVSAPAITTSGDTNTGIYFPAADTIAFTEGGAEAMRIDSSGNLGLGVTPSAWQSTKKAFQFGALGALNSDTATVALSNNTYIDSAGTTRYLQSSTQATYYYQNSGQHVWLNAPSGTAGNAITFTQAMTLDASGNLGIGTTSPGAKLDVAGTTYVRGDSSNATFTSPGQFALKRSNSAPFITWHQDDGTRLGYLQMQSSGVSALWLTANESFVFGTNNTERARIDSSGNLLVGATATAYGERLNVVTSGASASGGYFLYNSTDNRKVLILQHLRAGGATTATMMSFLNSSSSEVGSITSTSTATAYNTSSDYRLKDNPQPLTGSGAFIDALKPKTWNWTADGSKGVGFIAHEAQAVSPSSVVGEKDAVDADGKPVMQAMEYGSAEFIANIIAELQSLRARVAQLEGN